MSLVNFFESYTHAMNNKLTQKPFIFTCPAIYLSSDYCLIPFAARFHVDSIALYDMRNYKLIKIQRVPFYHNLLSNNVVYQVDFH